MLYKGFKIEGTDFLTIKKNGEDLTFVLFPCYKALGGVPAEELEAIKKEIDSIVLASQ